MSTISLLRGAAVPPVYNGAVLAAVLIGGTGFSPIRARCSFSASTRSPSGLPGRPASSCPGFCSCLTCARPAPTRCLPFSASASARVLCAPWRALLQLPPTALLLAAEIKVAALIMAMFLPLSHQLAVACVALIIACVTIVGGMRSLTWSASAQFIVGAVGFAVPLIIVSVLLTNLPAPQLTYGEMFEPLKRSEIVAGVSPSAPGELATALPREQPRPSTKPFLQAFGAVSRTDFLTLFLCLTLGAAALPSLLARSGVTSSVADQRRSVAWGVFFVAPVRHQRAGARRLCQAADVPGHCAIAGKRASSWLNDLNAYRLLVTRDANTDGAIEASELLIARDGIVLALPMAARLPFVCTVLMAAAGLAIALAAAASHLFTLAGSLADDVIRLIDPRSEVLPA